MSVHPSVNSCFFLPPFFIFDFYQNCFLQPSPANTELDLLSNDGDISPLAQSQQFDVSPMPDVSPSPSDLDGIDEEPPLTAPFDLVY